jgi:predicted S18 family serine protease
VISGKRLRKSLRVSEENNATTVLYVSAVTPAKQSVNLSKELNEVVVLIVRHRNRGFDAQRITN